METAESRADALIEFWNKSEQAKNAPFSVMIPKIARAINDAVNARVEELAEAHRDFRHFLDSCEETQDGSDMRYNCFCGESFEGEYYFQEHQKETIGAYICERERRARSQEQEECAKIAERCNSGYGAANYIRQRNREGI